MQEIRRKRLLQKYPNCHPELVEGCSNCLTSQNSSTSSSFDKLILRQAQDDRRAFSRLLQEPQKKEVRSKKARRTKKMLKRIFLLFVLIVIVTGCSRLHYFAKERVPAGMAYVPAGWFEMGSYESDGRLGYTIGVDEVPRHRVYVKGFYMDLYEVTNREFRDFVMQTDNPYRPSHWEEREAFEKGEENNPVVDVDWLDADSFCKWVGKRLPTEAEWEKAARGNDGRFWPWGNEYGTSKANTLESGILWTVPVGSYPEDVSPYGIHDMAGNVREWVDGWYNSYPGNSVASEHYTGPYRILRGGSYETPLYRYARSAARHAITSTIATRGHNWHSNFDHGVRCAKDL